MILVTKTSDQTLLDVRFVDAPAGVTPEEGDTGFLHLLRCLPQFLSREGFICSVPSSSVKLNFVYPRVNRSPLVGHFIIFHYFVYVHRKVRNRARNDTSVLT